jgi:hypothetical protein
MRNAHGRKAFALALKPTESQNRAARFHPSPRTTTGKARDNLLCVDYTTHAIETREMAGPEVHETKLREGPFARAEKKSVRFFLLFV